VAALQRQPRPPEDRPLWQRQLDDLLPGVGLVAEINRFSQLVERFGDAELRQLVGLIHARPDARALVRYYGVPGIFALEDTRVGRRLDVGAARLLLTVFPTPRRGAPATASSSPEVFSEEVVREAFLRFHYNAMLPRDAEHFAADLPPRVRRNCIAIVREMAPRLLAQDPVLSRRTARGLRGLSGLTDTMLHAGGVLRAQGAAHRPIVIRFKDAAGRLTNGNTEPARMVESAWDRIVAAVGDDYGWHVFGMAVMAAHHSVTLFVRNQPGGPVVYWADQWAIEPGEEHAFRQLPGSVSGFRRYDQAGLDGWIEQLTNRMWNGVHRRESECGRRHPRTWDRSCRYDATLTIWHLRSRRAGRGRP
jgi:hypothetical protein